MCAQRRLRSACASAQSDQSLRCAQEETLHLWVFKMRPLKILIRLRECAGWSESSMGARVRRFVSWRCGLSVVAFRKPVCASMTCHVSTLSFHGGEKRISSFLIPVFATDKKIPVQKKNVCNWKTPRENVVFSSHVALLLSHSVDIPIYEMYTFLLNQIIETSDFSTKKNKKQKNNNKKKTTKNKKKKTKTKKKRVIWK